MSGMFAYMDPKHPVPENQRTFNPDGTRIQPLSAKEQADEDAYYDRMRARYGDKVQPSHRKPSAAATTSTTTNTTPRRDSTATTIVAREGSVSSLEGEKGVREGGGEGKGEGEQGHEGKEEKQKGPLRKLGRKVWDSFDEHKRGAARGSYAWEVR